MSYREARERREEAGAGLAGTVRAVLRHEPPTVAGATRLLLAAALERYESASAAAERALHPAGVGCEHCGTDGSCCVCRPGGAGDGRDNVAASAAGSNQ